MAGGEQVHCLIQTPSGQGPATQIPPGVYSILPPIEHPEPGELIPTRYVQSGFALAGNLTRTPVDRVFFTYNYFDGGSPMGSGITDSLSQSAADNAITTTAAHPGSLILARGPLGGPNFLVITTGFEELIGLLHLSGGGTLEVIA
jgi:hypothetical protein